MGEDYSVNFVMLLHSLRHALLYINKLEALEMLNTNDQKTLVIYSMIVFFNLV